jgi:hypothetical protein
MASGFNWLKFSLWAVPGQPRTPTYRLLSAGEKTTRMSYFFGVMRAELVEAQGPHPSIDPGRRVATQTLETSLQRLESARHADATHR